mgnify:CR=1 FL=1
MAKDKEQQKFTKDETEFLRRIRGSNLNPDEIKALISQIRQPINSVGRRHSHFKNEYKSIQMKSITDSLLLGFGWYDIENDFRWMDRRSLVMFKIAKKKKLNLNFRAESIKENMKISVYLNKERVGEVILGMVIKDYKIPIDKDFIQGINYVYFIADKAYMPAEIIPGSLDKRKLSTKFSKIYLTEK